MKKIIILTSSVILLVAIVLTVVFLIIPTLNVKSNEDLFEYQIVTSNTIFIDKYLGDSPDVVIPDEIEGIEVRMVSGSTFLDCDDINSVFLGKNVEVFVYRAADMSSLKEIKVHEDNKFLYVEDGVLYDRSGTLIKCPSSKSGDKYVVKNGINSIFEYAFAGCEELVSVEIPQGVTYLGRQAFSGCYNLTTVKFPESVRYVGNEVFGGCQKLEDVNIPECIEKWRMDIVLANSNLLNK